IGAPELLAQTFQVVGGGALVGLVVGFPLDAYLVRRARARDGFDGIAWVAVLEIRENVARSEPGWVVPGERCVMFAAKSGTRRWIQSSDVTGEQPKARADQSSLALTLGGVPARLVVVGPGAGAIGGRLRPGMGAG